MQWLIIEALGDGVVDDVQPVEVVGDFLLCVRSVTREALSASDGFRTRDGWHLRSVQRHHAPANETLFATELNEGRAGDDNCLRIVVPERRDGAIVRRETPHQP